MSGFRVRGPGRHPRARAQRLEVLIGILGFFTLMAVIQTVTLELRGDPAAWSALVDSNVEMVEFPAEVTGSYKVFVRTRTCSKMPRNLAVAYCALMARYGEWMNERLHATLAGLDDVARRRDRGAFFGSMHEMGHALYEMGVAPDLEGTLLSSGASLGVRA